MWDLAEETWGRRVRADAGDQVLFPFLLCEVCDWTVFSFYGRSAWTPQRACGRCLMEVIPLDMNDMKWIEFQFFFLTMKFWCLFTQLRLLRQRVTVTHDILSLVVLFEHQSSSSGVKMLGPTFDGCTRQWWCFHVTYLCWRHCFGAPRMCVLYEVKTEYLTHIGWIPWWQCLSIVNFLEILLSEKLWPWCWSIASRMLCRFSLFFLLPFIFLALYILDVSMFILEKKVETTYLCIKIYTQPSLLNLD